MSRIALVGVALVCCLFVFEATGQDSPKYNNLRFQEDWSKMPDGGTGDFFDPIKKIDITDSIWLSVGGELRIRYESWENFGFAKGNDDAFTLFRTHLHSDWHFGEHWRVFLEGRVNTVNNRDLPGGKRNALDIDEGDVWNAFVQADYEIGGLDVTVRLGRQELQFGKQRLVSPLDWANNRRIFDGASVRLKCASGRQLDMFVTSPVIIRGRQEFTWNRTDDDRLFSGLYFTETVLDGRLGVDAYFLSLNHIDNAAIEEDRYTIGTRLYGKVCENISLEAEVAYQFGEREYKAGQRGPNGWLMDDEDIDAWMITLEGTYSLPDIACKPWFTLGFDYASGDADDQPFRHLFPLGHAYLAFTDVVGRQNIIDARATVGAWPIAGKLRTRADVHLFWLEDEDDALYNAGGGVGRSNMIPAFRGRFVTADEDQVGWAFDLTAMYKIDKHMSLVVGYSRFIAGEFIEATGPEKNIDFFYTQLSYDF